MTSIPPAVKFFTTPHSAQPRLLVVDRDADTIQFLLTVLPNIGEVFISGDESEALAFVDKHAPDLIFIGTDLSETNEQNFFLLMRQHVTGKAIPVIVIADRHPVNCQTLAQQTGAADMIGRPFDTAHVKTAAHRLLPPPHGERVLNKHLRRKPPATAAETDTLLKNLAAQVPGVIFQYRRYPDGRGTCPFISESIRSVAGLVPEDLYEDASAWDDLIHPDDQAAYFHSVDVSAADLAPWRHEFRLALPGQSEIWLRGESTPQKLADGSILWHGYIQDITARKQAKLIQEARENRLIATHRALHEANDAILRLQNESALFPLICRIAVQYGGMPLAWVGMPAADNRFHPAASYGTVDCTYTDRICIYADQHLPNSRGPISTAYRTQQTIVVNDIAHDAMMEPWRDAALEESLQAIAAFPILKAGQTYAVLAVYSEQVNAFHQEILSLLEQMTVNISFALENFDREAERKRSLHALQLTQLSLEKSVDPVFWVTEQGDIQFVNQAAAHYLGYSRDELMTMSIRDVNLQLTPEAWQRIWADIRNDGAKKFESQHRTRDGEMIPVDISANHVEHEGQEYAFAFIRDITERKKSEEALWKHANFDALTGLPNRRLFLERLNLELLKSRRVQLPLAMLFLDLDYFKNVNDTLGHTVGDLLLKESTERVKACVRKTDMVARLGGDEFTVILSELVDIKSVERIASDILGKMAEPFYLDNEVIYLSASIGITLYPHDASSGADLLKNADQAMYEAKKLGKNRYAYFDVRMQETAITRHRLIKYMHGALKRDQFKVVYQPIVELSTGVIRKAEALMRWQHPVRGNITPMEFIPLAEQTGMIMEMGDWVFKQVVNKVKHLRAVYQTDFQISINKSPVQFRNENGTHKDWEAYLNELGLPGHSIAIEITESLLMESTPIVTEKLRAFRAMGMPISLDDFGTGYSSLSYLKKFDLDYLKIDQSFVRNLSKDSPDLALCEAIIVMAHKLGIEVIAEGVETEEQCELLTAAGCDFAQGYWFSRPVSSDEFDACLIQNGQRPRRV